MIILYIIFTWLIICILGSGMIIIFGSKFYIFVFNFWIYHFIFFYLLLFLVMLLRVK